MSSFSMNAASSYGPRTMTVSCSQTRNGSSANTSTINWTLSTQGSNSSASLFDTGPTSLDIAGANRYWKERVAWSSYAFPAAAGSVSGSFTLSHKNDGTIDPINVSLSTAIYYAAVKTASGTWYLDKIDRYFSSTPSISLSNRTETSLTYNWSTSETCSKVVVYYKKSNESNYASTTKYDSSGATSGSFTLSGLAANTTYNVFIRATRKDSGLTSDSGVNNSTTYNYPHITGISASALTIGNGQTISLYNPLGRTVTVRMYQNSTSGTLLHTTGSTTGTSITFTPAADTLYKTIPNSQSSYCIYTSTSSNPSYTYTTASNTYSYKVSGGETPTFAASQVSTYDSTSSVTAVTGQTGAGGWLVQALSQLKVTIDSAATAKNHASISKYEVTFAGTKKDLSVGTTGGTWGTLNSSGTQSISIKVIDSRNLSTTVTKNVTFKPYQAPTITLTGGRENNYGTVVNLLASFTSSSVEGFNGIKVSWSGADFSGYFKDSNNNQLGSSSSFVSAFSGDGTATQDNIDNEVSYTFTATIEDRFGKKSSSTLKVPISLPLMFIDSEQNGVGVNCLPTGKGLYVDGDLAVGGKNLQRPYTVDLSTYSSSTFYPILFTVKYGEILKCDVYSEGGQAAEAYNQNLISFTCHGGGWSDTPRSLTVNHYGCYSNSEITIGCIGDGNKDGSWCIWVRGSKKYFFYSNFKPEFKPSGYTSNSGEVFSPGSNYYGGTNTQVTIRFTPQTTLTSGMFVGNNVVVGGELCKEGNGYYPAHRGDAADANNCKTHGYYRTTTSTANLPSGAGSKYGILEVVESRGLTWSSSNEASWFWQIFRNTSNEEWHRYGSNSSISSWTKRHIDYTYTDPYKITEQTATYTKYANGLLVQHFSFKINCSISNAWGSGYEVQVTGGQFPIAFKTCYACNVTPLGRGCFIEYVHGANVSKLTHAINGGWLYRPVSDEGTKWDYDFYCIAYGTWK